MNNVARLIDAELNEPFCLAADKMGLSPAIIERNLRAANVI